MEHTHPTAHEALQRHLAGQQVRVPRDPSKLLHKLESMSAEEARTITEAYGGTRIYCRKQTREFAEARNDRIRVRRTHGATIEQLATEFDLSARQISNILRSYPQ